MLNGDIPHFVVTNGEWNGGRAFRGLIRSAPSRSQRESAVGRRRAQPHPSPFARKTAPLRASATATLQARPLLLANQECPHYLAAIAFLRAASNSSPAFHVG